MRKFFALIAVVLLVASMSTAFARVDQQTPESVTKALMRGEMENDVRAFNPSPTMRDTIDFGFYEVRLDGLKYAVVGGKWTFDHGAADPLEGWTTTDLTSNIKTYWRQITQSKWIAEGGPLPWPALNASAGYVLCGATKGHADSLGWASGIGYGNNWCQRLTSPTYNYDGSGAVDLSFNYFNETEIDYDYSKVFVTTTLVETLLNPPGFNGSIGIDTLGNIAQATYTRPISNADFGGGASARNFTLRVEFRADGGLSDEDGNDGWDAYYGAIGVDNIALSNNMTGGDVSYNFDADLQGWTVSKCPGAGSFMGVNPLSSYVIQDPCACELAGNILEFHNAAFQHPDDLSPVPQHEQGFSAICDRKADIGDPLFLDYNRVIAEWDQYSEMPQANGVFYRPGWSYYPYENPNIPGYITWSPRIGQGTYFYVGTDPLCSGNTNIGTDWGLPPTSEKVKFIYEVNSTCAGFGIAPEVCTDITNFTPIIDNIRVRNVGVANAPAMTFITGCTFQDGFGSDQIGGLSTTDPGWVNITYDSRMGNETAVSKQGDSLVITGPVPASATKWESKLWLRVKREGPGQSSNTTYTTWKNAWIAARGIQFTPPQKLFTWGYMDSIEAANQASKNKFCSQFRDGPSTGGNNLPKDLMYSWGPDTGEQDEGNEMIPDLALTPGTKIDYFVTSNYICLPTTYFYLPDTTGKFYNEIEILPSFRLDGGQAKFPCVLYVDAFNRGGQFYIENALNVVLNGASSGAPIPDPTTWDRYDYLDASSNWKAPFYREYGGNSGGTIPQLLGYRAILINTGYLDTGCAWPRDWLGIQSWLTASICDGNLSTQSFIADGTWAGKIISAGYPSLLTQNMGATHRCDSYFEVNCPTGETENDQNYCVRVNPVAGSVFGSDVVPTDVFGNWCPPKVAFGVLGTTGTGVGNKNFVKVGSGTVTNYAQIINDRNSAAEKYRTVVDGFSYNYLTARDANFPNDPVLECPSDSGSIVTATFYEIRNALKWSLNVSNLGTLGLCQVPGNCGQSVPEDNGGSALVNRLFQNSPNPFNPRTMIKFSLAQGGPAQLVIYDVNGRKVKTLVNGQQTAGPHEVVWDGTNDSGQQVASGVFWSKLTVNDWSSNKKMVVLK